MTEKAEQIHTQPESIRDEKSPMKSILDLTSDAVKSAMEILLKDRATGENILFATEEYDGIPFDSQMTKKWVYGEGLDILRPRVLKRLEEQSKRTRKRAEVFTPSWICNKMNNHCDVEWFGRKNPFNTEDGQAWKTILDKINFPEGRTWKDYILSTRLEITCGEAPYLVSRYDAATGDIIPIADRIGMLDRKLRVINENTNSHRYWNEWVYRAFESVYGYEYQGDSLLIARMNLLETFCEYTRARWQEEPSKSSLKRIANIISWNLWQMDGIYGVVPFQESDSFLEEAPLPGQISFLEDMFPEETSGTIYAPQATDCVLYDWKTQKKVKYQELKKGRENEI